LHGEVFVKTGSGFERLELKREYENINALTGYLPLAEIISFTDDSHCATMITRKIDGKPMHECWRDMGRPQLVEILSDVLRTLWLVKPNVIVNLTPALAQELADIGGLIKQRQINEEDFAQRSGGTSVTTAWELVNRTAKLQDNAYLSHGDLCLPNIIVTPQHTWALIDWGKGGKGDRYRDLAALKGSLERNVDTTIFNEVLAAINIHQQDLDFEKIDFYKLMDIFWYSATVKG
jgi:aminoglycoside phosphotransferase